MTDNISLKVGDRIRIKDRYGCEDFTIEEFRQCLGYFSSPEARKAGHFTPLCELYEHGPLSKQSYISNYGEYTTNEVPMWMNIPKK